MTFFSVSLSELGTDRNFMMIRGTPLLESTSAAAFVDPGWSASVTSAAKVPRDGRKNNKHPQSCGFVHDNVKSLRLVPDTTLALVPRPGSSFTVRHFRRVP